MIEVNNEKNNLDYITEVSPEELKGLFFMDYKHTENVRWVREPWMDARDLVIHTATMDWSKVKDFRVQSYEDLVQPVNEDGFTKYQCESRNIDFAPECQKIEWFFGSMYRIERGMFEVCKDRGLSGRLEKGLYFEEQTGLIVSDLETTISSFAGSDDAFKCPDNSLFLLDMSCHEEALSDARKTLEDNGLDLSWGSIFMEKLLEDALIDLSFDPKPESHNAILHLKELDGMTNKRTAA